MCLVLCQCFMSLVFLLIEFWSFLTPSNDNCKMVQQIVDLKTYGSKTQQSTAWIMFVFTYLDSACQNINMDIWLVTFAAKLRENRPFWAAIFKTVMAAIQSKFRMSIHLGYIVICPDSPSILVGCFYHEMFSRPFFWQATDFGLLTRMLSEKLIS